MRNLLFTILMLLWMTTPAHSEEPEAIKENSIPVYCVGIQPFLSHLQEKFGETLVFMSGSKNVYGHDLFHQLWMNPESQTWSFLVTNKDTETLCIMASGQGFIDLRGIGI